MSAVAGHPHLPPLPDAEASLDYWQTHIGRWAGLEFGPTPVDLHALRLTKEALDVMDAAATGDVDGRDSKLASALAGVLVVALAMAAQNQIDLCEALETEQARNLASEWRSDAFGQWFRVDADPEDPAGLINHFVSLAVSGAWPPARVAQALGQIGLSVPKAYARMRAAGVDIDRVVWPGGDT
jgi:NTP pyrophosphatase (non-canonical NTP hydrolase)